MGVLAPISINEIYPFEYESRTDTIDETEKNNPDENISDPSTEGSPKKLYGNGGNIDSRILYAIIGIIVIFALMAYR